MSKLVSVIIPVYNGDRYLTEAIQSVMAQTYPNLEIIVIDDGSCDRTPQIVAEITGTSPLPIRYAYQANQGTSIARNHGVKVAQGEFLAFLDADDLWMPEKTKQQIELLDASPHLEAVFGQVKQFHSPELPENIKAKIHCPPGLILGIIPSNFLVRKASFDRVGEFNPDYRLGEFLDWYIRAMELQVEIGNVSELVTLRRLHNFNKGLVLKSEMKNYTTLLKAALDRRRQV
jgi:glycosyltransferase involved in cell wall biosynthesis